MISFISSSAQVKVRDLEGWAGFKIRKTIGEKVKLSLEEQIRFDHNSTQLDDWVSEVEGGYSWFQMLSTAVGFRYIRHKTTSGDFENRYRWHLQSTYEHEINRVDLAIRARFQSRNDQDETQALNVLRFKTGVQWNPKGLPIDPYTSVEGFFKLPGRTSFGYPGIRWTAGGIWKINKNHRLRAFYHLEYNTEEYYPLWINRVGIRYDFRL